MTRPVDDAETARHRAKMAKRKAVQDAEVAGKTTEKGLLIVHTGKGKGKSTAAFGLMLRALKSFGHFWYDFVIGDDWHVAAIVVAALGLTALLVHVAGVNAWWLVPLAAFAALAWSLRRATSGKS